MTYSWWKSWERNSRELLPLRVEINNDESVASGHREIYRPIISILSSQRCTSVWPWNWNSCHDNHVVWWGEIMNQILPWFFLWLLSLGWLPTLTRCLVFEWEPRWSKAFQSIAWKVGKPVEPTCSNPRRWRFSWGQITDLPKIMTWRIP